MHKICDQLIDRGHEVLVRRRVRHEISMYMNRPDVWLIVDGPCKRRRPFPFNMGFEKED